MNKEECSCSDQDQDIICRTCGNDTHLPYWCETCERLVPEKRCPCCGLKARKVTGPATCDVKFRSRGDT